MLHVVGEPERRDDHRRKLLQAAAELCLPKCYFCAVTDHHVGVRELRQNLSVYLRRIAQGERLIVTERRRPVAVISPLPEQQSMLEWLIATGEVSEAVGDILDFDPLPADPANPTTLTQEILKDREDRL